MADDSVKLRSFGSCPICGRPAVEEVRPFCSPNCRHLDLGRWLGEGYAIQAGGALAEVPEASPPADENG